MFAFEMKQAETDTLQNACGCKLLACPGRGLHKIWTLLELKLCLIWQERTRKQYL